MQFAAMLVLFCLVVALLPPLMAEEGAGAAPVVIAHRGASGYLPEHTLEATAMAHAFGADYIEQDVVLSKDGIPVVLHDIYLDAVTDVATRYPGRAREDGRSYAIDFVLKELKELQVVERFRPETGERVYPGRYAGGGPSFRIPTLEEVLQLVAGLNASTGREAGIYVEIKQPAWHHRQGVDLGAAVLPLLDEFGYREKSDRCFLQCFEFPEVKRLREELGYRGRLVQLLRGGNKEEDRAMRSPEGLRELRRFVDGVGPPVGEVVQGDAPGAYKITRLVEDAHDLDLLVHPYTARADDLPKWANDYGEVLRILGEAGVDGYFTDFPGMER